MGCSSRRWPVSARLPLLLVCWASCDASRPAPLTPPASLVPSSLIVTAAPYLDGFARLARLHTLTGVPTEVVTVEELCAASGGCREDDACNDTARTIKDDLARRQAAGLRRVLLGGDLTVVPSRQTRDSYVNLLLGLSHQRTFHTDHYYADLSEWDGNGDCLYGDLETDAPDYLPELAVTRIPAGSADELAAYVAKVERYLTDYDVARIGTALFLSNLATELALGDVGSVPVDSSVYFESPGRTLSLIPGTFAISKLYSPVPVPEQIAALQAGHNLVVHAGHGGASQLTVEHDGSNGLTAEMAAALENQQLPIMLSCACQAADLAAPVSAGRSFVMAPRGGGIGYLGNATVGLGMAGGLQLIDEVLRHAFAAPGTLVGDAVAAARGHLPRTDTFVFSGLPVLGSIAVRTVDEQAWRWTQKAATYLGDGLLPIHTDVALRPAPTFAVSSRRAADRTTLTFQPSPASDGTLTVAIDGSLYVLELEADGRAVPVTVRGSPGFLAYGFTSASSLASYRELTIP